MQKTAKRWIGAIAFLAILGYLFVHISYMCRGELAHTRDNLSGYYDLEKNSLDVVIVGTSGTFSSFSPMDAWEKYGFASYNFCINVLGADGMANAVHEAMKTQEPKALVIDVYPFIVSHAITNLEENYARYNTDGYKYSIDRLKLIWDTFSDTRDKIPYVFDLIKYHDNSFDWMNFFSEYHFVEKGFNFLPWAAAQPAILTDSKQTLGAEFENYLNQLLEDCGKLDTYIQFIYYPYGDVESVDDIAMVNYIQEKVEEAGYPFLNCVRIRDQFELDYSHDAWGPGHFNIYGAEKITSVVGEYLKNTYDLPDRRNDPDYTEWNEDIYLYHQNVKSSKSSVDAAIAADG